MLIELAKRHGFEHVANGLKWSIWHHKELGIEEFLPLEEESLSKFKEESLIDRITSYKS